MGKLLITLLFLVALVAVTVKCSDRSVSYSRAAENRTSGDQQPRKCKELYVPCRAGECCYPLLCHNYDKKCLRPYMWRSSGASLHERISDLEAGFLGTDSSYGPGHHTGESIKDGPTVSSSRRAAAGAIPLQQRRDANE